MTVPTTVTRAPALGEWECSRCFARFALRDRHYLCPSCCQRGRLTLRIDYRRAGPPVSGIHSMWRYASLLPVRPDILTATAAALPVGWTPMPQLTQLGHEYGLQLWVKNEACNPTGSLKDRASALVAAKALELGEQVVTTASSGNAAVALAGACAAVALRSVVFVPHNTPTAKLQQISAYGATVFRVLADYDHTVRLSMAAADKWGWYCRNTAVNPFTAEGKKTVALEIVEQLHHAGPDAVVVPTGDGNILFGVYRGFLDALHLGWIDRMPRLIGVQSSAAPALVKAWEQGSVDVQPTRAESLAESINVGTPQDGYRALAAVRQTHGVFVAVDDDEIAPAARRLARDAGILAEFASATALAALPRLLQAHQLRPGERVVIINTGSGIRSLSSLVPEAPAAIDVRPNLEDLRHVFSG